MFGRKLAIETVPESEYTDFSDRKEFNKEGLLVGTGIAATASLATYAGVSVKHYSVSKESVNKVTETMIPVQQEVAAYNLPENLIDTAPIVANTDINTIQTGLIADTSLDILTTILDPVTKLMVAVSLPVASVIMLGACFYFMFGNKEKAWGTIFNASLGYIMIQFSPLFLSILKELGKAV